MKRSIFAIDPVVVDGVFNHLHPVTLPECLMGIVVDDDEPPGTRHYMSCRYFLFMSLCIFRHEHLF